MSPYPTKAEVDALEQAQVRLERSSVFTPDYVPTIQATCDMSPRLIALVRQSMELVGKLSDLVTTHGPECHACTIGAILKKPGWECNCGKKEAAALLRAYRGDPS